MNKLAVVLVGLLAIGVVSAVLVSYYGKITTTIEVEQSILLTGPGCTDNECAESTTVSGGETYMTSEYSATSSTSVEVPVKIESTPSPVDGGIESMTNVYHLAASGTQGTEDRIRVLASDTGVATLGDLNTISWAQYVDAGYIGHVDVKLDTDFDGVVDEALVFEYDKEEAPSDQTVGDMGYGRNTWVNTFDDKGSIVGGSIAWLNSGAPGPVGGAGYFAHTLNEWKAGQVDNGKFIDAATPVIAFEFEVDNWILDSDVLFKEILINGADAEVIQIQPSDSLEFTVAIKIADNAVGTYQVNTEVVPQ